MDGWDITVLNEGRRGWRWTLSRVDNDWEQTEIASGFEDGEGGAWKAAMDARWAEEQRHVAAN